MTAELPRIPDALASSPASDKVVWRWLDDAARPLTKRELRALTRIEPRTLDAALRRLREAGLLTRTSAPDDSPCTLAYALER